MGVARAAAIAAAAFTACLAIAVPRARAVVLPATTIDGPSQSIVGFSGVAMAEDGTGGLVYLKSVGGVAHVFVSQYIGDRWLTPIRVDDTPFAASSPRIGAADGGRLVVVWATPFATVKERPLFELRSATLGAGATQFQSSVIVDQNIGEGVATSPQIAMNAAGQAYLTYRVTEPLN